MPWPGSLSPDNAFWFFEVLGVACLLCVSAPLQQFVVYRAIVAERARAAAAAEP